MIKEGHKIPPSVLVKAKRPWDSRKKEDLCDNIPGSGRPKAAGPTSLMLLRMLLGRVRNMPSCVCGGVGGSDELRRSQSAVKDCCGSMPEYPSSALELGRRSEAWLPWSVGCDFGSATMPSWADLP